MADIMKTDGKKDNLVQREQSTYKTEGPYQKIQYCLLHIPIKSLTVRSEGWKITWRIRGPPPYLGNGSPWVKLGDIWSMLS